jgi:hypothetical protein
METLPSCGLAGLEHHLLVVVRDAHPQPRDDGDEELGFIVGAAVLVI